MPVVSGQWSVVSGFPLTNGGNDGKAVDRGRWIPTNERRE